MVTMLASTVFEGYRCTGAALAGMALVLTETVLVLRVKEPRPGRRERHAFVSSAARHLTKSQTAEL